MRPRGDGNGETSGEYFPTEHEALFRLLVSQGDRVRDVGFGEFESVETIAKFRDEDGAVQRESKDLIITFNIAPKHKSRITNRRLHRTHRTLSPTPPNDNKTATAKEGETYPKREPDISTPGHLERPKSKKHPAPHAHAAPAKSDKVPQVASQLLTQSRPMKTQMPHIIIMRVIDAPLTQQKPHQKWHRMSFVATNRLDGKS